MKILLLSDIHGNFPALQAIAAEFKPEGFDRIINCGDSLVYAPFPNETLSWLRRFDVLSILGNTDKKVIKLLHGKSFKKPSKPDKRVMYTSTAEALTTECSEYLQSFPQKDVLPLPRLFPGDDPRRNSLGIFHGSPEKPHEFLFATSPVSRFRELALKYPYAIIATGHSHTPYHYHIEQTHFINPGSAGRMFDGNPEASCAVLEVSDAAIEVSHHRIPYNVKNLIHALDHANLPEIYREMFIRGRKLN